MVLAVTPAVPVSLALAVLRGVTMSPAVALAGLPGLAGSLAVVVALAGVVVTLLLVLARRRRRRNVVLLPVCLTGWNPR